MDDVLGMVGLAFLSGAAFTIGATVGLAVVGGCLLFVAWRMGRS